MSNLNIRVPATLADRLGELSSKTGRTKSYYVRAALEEKLEALEDCYLALQSLEQVETGQSRIWTHHEIVKGLDHE